MKNVKNADFLGFDLEDVICANFHGHICNQQVKTRSIRSFKAIGGDSLSEVHSNILKVLDNILEVSLQTCCVRAKHDGWNILNNIALYRIAILFS